MCRVWFLGGGGEGGGMEECGFGGEWAMMMMMMMSVCNRRILHGMTECDWRMSIRARSQDGKESTMYKIIEGEPIFISKYPSGRSSHERQ